MPEKQYKPGEVPGSGVGPRGQHRFTSETARIASAKGRDKARATIARKKELRGDIRAKEAFERDADKLAAVIIAAAMGQGEYARLDPKDRANFALKGLEYAIGRPRPMAEHSQEPAAAAGISFARTEGDGDGLPAKSIPQDVGGAPGSDLREQPADDPARVETQ